MRVSFSLVDINNKTLYENDSVLFGNRMKGFVKFQKGAYGIQITEPEYERKFIPFFEMHITENGTVFGVEKIA